MKKTIKDFVEKNIVVKINTKEDAYLFLAACQKAGLKWTEGQKPLELVEEVVGSYLNFFYGIIYGDNVDESYEKTTVSDFDLSFKYEFDASKHECESHIHFDFTHHGDHTELKANIKNVCGEDMMKAIKLLVNQLSKSMPVEVILAKCIMDDDDDVPYMMS